MCPACMATAALVAGSVISTGGIAVLAAKICGFMNKAKLFGLNNPIEGRNDYGFSDQQRRAR